MGFWQKLFPKADQLEALSPGYEELPKKAVPFIWHFVKKLGSSYAGNLVAYAIGGITVATEPYFVGLIVGTLAAATPETMWQLVWPIILAYFVVVQIISRVAYQLGHYMEAMNGPLLRMLVRRQLANYLSRHSYRFFSGDFAGRLAGKVVEMPGNVTQVLDDLLNPILFTLITGLTALALFIHINLWLALTFLAFALINGIVIAIYAPKISARATLAATAQHTMRGRYIDSISNMLLVKLFATETLEDRLFSKAQVETGAAEQHQGLMNVALYRWQHILNASFLMTVLLLSLWLYQHGAMSLADVTAAFGLVLMLVGNIWWLLMTCIGFFSRFAAIEEALETIIQPHEVTDPAAPAKLELASPSIAVENITFAYPARPVFNNFSLAIPATQRLGLVGPSGAGKSTLVQLLLRLYDVQSGSISIGGQNIASISQHDLRRSISVIPQATDLLHRTIYENIAYGCPDATPDEVQQAAREAHIHDTIMALTDESGNKGYDALVGERGVRLSGGQRQRIAIARAFLKRAPIIILDEPTSALDSESERLIQQSLQKLLQGRTAIVIAHRLSTISHLDRIIVLQNGTIAEDGSHASLLANNGLYARLWALQSEGFLGELKD